MLSQAKTQMKTTQYDLSTCSMLVEFNASVWTARKLDKGVTDEVVHNKQAQAKGAARVNKNLLAGRHELDDIQSHVGAVRTWVYANTLPWSDNGLRLLPTTKFLDFDKHIKEEQDKFYDMVRDFKALYPTLITAQAMALGQMFNREDFPTTQQIEDKFAFNVGYIPVPASGDFRVNVGNAAQAYLCEQYEKMAEQRVELAMNDFKDRLKDHLVRMSDRLTVDIVDGEEKTRKFNDSLLDSALDLCVLAKDLNVTRDPEVEEVRATLQSVLAGVSIDTLRKSTTAKTKIKTEVDNVMNKLGW
jgi:hypothetical protein